MKKGNSVTKKVRRRRRIGGKYGLDERENPIKIIPGTPRTTRTSRTTRTPRTTRTDLRENGRGNVDNTLNLLTSLYGRNERNGGRTYKNKYKTKTSNNLKPKQNQNSS
jgi:hypothetical protein